MLIIISWRKDSYHPPSLASGESPGIIRGPHLMESVGHSAARGHLLPPRSTLKSQGHHPSSFRQGGWEYSSLTHGCQSNFQVLSHLTPPLPRHSSIALALPESYWSHVAGLGGDRQATKAGNRGPSSGLVRHQSQTWAGAAQSLLPTLSPRAATGLREAALVFSPEQGTVPPATCPPRQWVVTGDRKH